MVSNEATPPQTLSLAPAATSINNSKSLIDFKSSDEATVADATGNSRSDGTTDTDQPPSTEQTNQVDMLFDLDASFTLSSEPIKQGASYFDLIGLSSSVDSSAPQAPQQPVNTVPVSLAADLLSLVNPEIDTSNSESATASSGFKDELLESFIRDEYTSFFLQFFFRLGMELKTS